MVGEVINLDELWPVQTVCTHGKLLILDRTRTKIINMRQYKVLTEADFAPNSSWPTEYGNNSNPWGVGSHLRADWAKELGVKTLAEDPLWNICSTWAAPDHLTTGVKGHRGLCQDPPGGGRQLRHPRYGRELLRRFGHAGR